MQNFMIDQDTLTELQKYLVNKPFIEVTNLLSKIAQLKPVNLVEDGGVGDTKKMGGE